MCYCNDGDFPRFFDSRKISGVTDIGIPNGPAEEGTRGLLKARDPKFYQARRPNRDIVWKDRIVLGILTCNYCGMAQKPSRTL